jgi:hypothetical protein
MSAVHDLIDRYCAAWSDRDPRRRSELLAQASGERAAYTDRTVHAASAEELLAHIGRVLKRRSGAKVLRKSEIDVHHEWCRFAWSVVQPNGTVLREGIDIVELTPDRARIERIIGCFGSPASVE